MRHIFIAVGLISTIGFGAFAQENTIEDVISDQISALKSGDIEGAFSHASPNIQRLFGTPDVFGDMVQNGYPMVMDPAKVEHLDQITNGNYTLQRLRIQDRSGDDHWFAYEMILVNGNWRINGVYRIDPPGLNV